MMEKNIKLCMNSYSIIVILFFSSCGQHVKEVNNEPATAVVQQKKDSFSNGYTRNVSCKNDASQSYELFLPSQYDGSRAFPAIVIFDAHARGHLPVELYKSLADSFGYIMAASNNSKNGQAPELSDHISETLIADVKSRFTVDERRIYTMGFSGGSRVASGIALYKGGIAGVIGCSAGFPKSDKPPLSNFNFIGIVGNEDFNLTEMNGLDHTLQQSSIRHQLLIFNGKHDWCPSETMKDAFYWITFNAMRDQLIAVNDTLIKQFLNAEEKRINEFEKNSKTYDLYQEYNKVANYLDGLHDVNEFRNKSVQLQNSDKVRTYEAYLKHIESEENRLQKQYADFITSRDISWWQAEVNQLNDFIKKDKKPEEALFKKRLLSYCSLLAYMYSNSALNSNQLDQAAHFLKIYELVDPTNSEHAYFTAELMMKYNNPERAVASLEEAVRLGFEDKQRLADDPAFSSIRNDENFKRITDLIK
jgi:hypothetical protein